MDKLRDSLRVKKFNGKENEDLSEWSLRIMAIFEGKGPDGVVAGSKRESSTDNVEAFALY